MYKEINKNLLILLEKSLKEDKEKWHRDDFLGINYHSTKYILKEDTISFSIYRNIFEFTYHFVFRTNYNSYEKINKYSIFSKQYWNMRKLIKDMMKHCNENFISYDKQLNAKLNNLINDLNTK